MDNTTIVLTFIGILVTLALAMVARIGIDYIRPQLHKWKGLGGYKEEGGKVIIQEIITADAWGIIDRECFKHLGCKGCVFATDDGYCTITIMCDKVRLLDKKEGDK